MLVNIHEIFFQHRDFWGDAPHNFEPGGHIVPPPPPGGDDLDLY